MNCVYIMLSMFASYLMLYLAGTVLSMFACTMTTVHILVQVGAHDARTNLGTTFKAPTNLGALEFLRSKVT